MASIEDRWKERTQDERGIDQFFRNQRGARYRVIWRERDATGKLRKKTKPFHRLADAREYRDKVNVQEQRNRAGLATHAREPHTITFAEVVDQWTATPVGTRRESPRKGTTDSVRGHMKRIKDHFGYTTLDSVRADRSKVRAFVAALKAENIGTADTPKFRQDNTINKYLATLGACYSMPYEFGWTTERLPKPELPKTRIRPRKLPALTVDQINAVADAVPARYRMFYKLAAVTGLRISELRGLRREHLKLDDAVLEVRWQANKNGDQLTALKVDEDRAYRDVPIALPTLIRELRAHLRDTEVLAAKRPDLDLVFPNENGRPYDIGNLNKRAWIPARATVGIDSRVTFHHYRRSYGSHLFGKLGDITLVAKLMGDTEEVVVKHYMVERPEAANRVNDALRELFEPTKPKKPKRVRTTNRSKRPTPLPPLIL